MFDFRCGQLTRCNVIQAAVARNLRDVNLERLAKTHSHTTPARLSYYQESTTDLTKPPNR